MSDNVLVWMKDGGKVAQHARLAIVAAIGVRGVFLVLNEAAPAVACIGIVALEVFFVDAFLCFAAGRGPLEIRGAWDD